MFSEIIKFLEEKKLLQFIKFALVGGVSAVLEISILTFLTSQYGKTNLLIFNTIAYGFAVVFNYILSRKYVFETGKYGQKTEFLAFCVVATIGLGINSTILYLGVHYLLLEVFFAKILAIGITVLWNFFAKKTFVFKG